MKIIPVLVLLTSLITITGCVGDGIVLGGEDDWQVVPPESLGLSQTTLDEAGDKVGEIFGRQCLVIIKQGKLVYEKYYRGDQYTRNNGYSATKSYAATLLGVAEHQGYFSLDDKLSHWLPDHPAVTNPDATIRHVLGQVAESNPPGSKFKYNNGDLINSLSDLIAVSTQQNPVQFAYDQLLGKIGINHSFWGEDFTSDLPISGGGGWTCRDMARFGQLYLNGGTWNGERLISEDYLNQATSPSYPEANGSHGFLWWLNVDAEKWYRIFSSGTGKMIPDAPASMYMASGALGQLVVVVPEAELVITSAGITPRLETMKTTEQVWQALAPALGY